MSTALTSQLSNLSGPLKRSQAGIASLCTALCTSPLPRVNTGPPNSLPGPGCSAHRRPYPPPPIGAFLHFTPALWSPCHPTHRSGNLLPSSLHHKLFFWPRTFFSIHLHDSLQVSCPSAVCSTCPTLNTHLPSPLALLHLLTLASMSSFLP